MATKIIYVRIEEQLDPLIEEEAKRLGIGKGGFVSLLINNYFDDIRFERRRATSDGSPGHEVATPTS